MAAAYQSRTTAVDLGYEVGLSETESGRLVGGVGLTFREGDFASSSPFGSGGGSARGFGVGPVLTFYGDDGSYVDARLTGYSFNLRPDGVSGAVNGSALTASVEAGRRFDLERGWGFTPEAQLSYASVDHDSFVGVDGETVAPVDGDQTTLRVSAVLDRSWDAKNGTASAHLGLDVFKPLDGDTSVSVNGSRFSRSDDAVRVGLSAGFDVTLDENAQIRGELSGSRGRDGSSDLNAGLSVRWSF